MKISLLYPSLTCLSSISTYIGCGCVILHNIHVPRVVLNGTLPFVLLDCQYALNHSERDGMVLKWYLNGNTIYQWIPPSKPQVKMTRIIY